MLLYFFSIERRWDFILLRTTHRTQPAPWSPHRQKQSSNSPTEPTSLSWAVESLELRYEDFGEKISLYFSFFARKELIVHSNTPRRSAFVHCRWRTIWPSSGFKMWYCSSRIG
jgi:hypothetical protein